MTKLDDFITTLERTTAFVKALPEDLAVQPSIRLLADSVVLDFVKLRRHFSSVTITATGPLNLRSVDGREERTGWFAFDGTKIPSDVIASIRRVTE
jgi:hypothetical protein